MKPAWSTMRTRRKVNTIIRSVLHPFLHESKQWSHCLWCRPDAYDSFENITHIHKPDGKPEFAGSREECPYHGIEEPRLS